MISPLAALVSGGLFLGSHLVIVMDDVGWTGVGAYQDLLPPGTRIPNTPVLDTVAKNGVRFTRAYVNPICGPTRAALLTGRHGFRTGMGVNVFNSTPGGLTDSETWLAEALEGTHATGLFGKWHLGASDNGRDRSMLDPAQGGVAHFDHHSGISANITAPDQDYFNWYRLDNGIATKVGDPDGVLTRNPRDYNTTQIVDAAIDWINAQSGDWLAVVSFSAAHRPYGRPPTPEELKRIGRDPLLSPDTETLLDAFASGDDAAIEAAGWGDVHALSPINLAAYHGMVEAMDSEMGRLLTDIDANYNPIAGDTTVWVLGDNGPEFEIVEYDKFDPAHSKGSLYELSVRAPFLVAGRGVKQLGSSCPRLVQHVDVYSTILAMEGVAAPPVDGVDISPLLRNVHAPGPRQYAYSEIFAPNGPIADPLNPSLFAWGRTIEDEGWKLLTFLPNGTSQGAYYELYRISTGEPGELVLSLPVNPGAAAAAFEGYDFLAPGAMPKRRTEPLHALKRLVTAERALLSQ